MTEVYGASDDLIEFAGDFQGECGSFADAAVSARGDFIIMSDGTILEIIYGKDGRAIWEIKLIERGALFERIDSCTDEDAARYSDTAYFREGIRWAYAAKEGERIS